MTGIVNDLLVQLKEVNTEIQHRVNQNNFDQVIFLLDKRSDIVSKFLQNQTIPDEEKVECILSIREQDKAVMDQLNAEREKSRESLLSFKRIRNYFK